MLGGIPIGKAKSNLIANIAHRFVFFLVLVSLVLPRPAFAQAVDLPVHFVHISLEQGLSSLEIWSLLRDNRGFMWFGTLDGLNRYDGYEMKVFQHDNDDPGSLSENTVRTIYLDKAGELWIGTWSGGLNRYSRDTESFVHYRHDPEISGSLSNNSVFAILEVRAGSLWVGTRGGGLNRFDSQMEVFTRYQHDAANPASLSNDNIYVLLEDDSGALWVGTDGGLDRFDPQTETFTHYQNDPDDPDSLSNNAIRALYQDKSGFLWVGTFGGGLDRLALRSASGDALLVGEGSDTQLPYFSHYRNDPDDLNSLSDDSIFSILQDDSGKMWIGTIAGGLNQLDVSSGIIKRYTPDQINIHGFGAAGVFDMFLDTEAMWFATGDGVYLLDRHPKPFHNLRHDPNDTNSLSFSEINSIYVDSQGILWVATENGGLDRVDRDTGQVTHYRHDEDDPSSLGYDNIWAIAPNQNNGLWLATFGGGLDQFNPETGIFTHYRHDPTVSTSLGSDLITTVYEDSEGVVWVGTWNVGVDRFIPEKKFFDHFQHDPSSPTSLSDNTIMTIYEERSGVLCVGTIAGGLNLLDREAGTITHYQHDLKDPASLSSNNISAVYEDSRGVLWVGTWDGGLNRMNPDMTVARQYDRSDGLPSASVFGILEDRQGHLWISSNRGLSKFDTQADTFRNYDQSDGLPGISFEQGVAYRSPTGEMFFGANDGLTAFFPDQIQDRRKIPPVVITDFLLANRPVSIGGDSVLQNSILETRDLILTYRDRVFTFKFAALNYISPQKNRFRYQLEGFDQGWTEVDSTNRDATYTNLDPGKYVFRVIGSNNDGIWNEEGASIDITITPPWWQTIWFQVITGFLLVGLVAGSFIRQRGQADRRQQKLEALVVERTRDLQDARTQISNLFDSSPLGITIATIDGVILGVNSAMQHITGYSEDELLDINVQQLYAEPVQRTQVLEQLGTTGNLQDYGIKLRRRDGSIYFASLNLSRLEMAGQEVLLGVVDDVSEQVQIREALTTLHHISYDISSIADLPTLLTHGLEHLYSIVDFQVAALMILEEGGELMTIHAYLTPTMPPGLTVNQVAISNMPSIQTILEQRETAYVPDLLANEAMQAGMDKMEPKMWADTLRGSRSWLSLPLQVGERMVGLLNIFHREANRYNSEEIELAQTFANQFAVAIDNIRLNEQSKLVAAANERSRIARELHDSVTQTLFTASVLAQATPRIWEKDPDIARQNMEKLSVLIRGALAEMRSLLFELRSAGLNNQTLGQLLTTFAEASRTRTHAAISLSVTGDLTLPENVALVFYRIAQEGLNNAINHSEAAHINISLLEEQDRVELRIKDDGHGLVPRVIPEGHLGISIMLERAGQIGADLRILSEPSRGTEVILTWSGEGEPAING